MRIDLLTLFPRMVEGFFSESILGRAVRKGILTIHVHDIRNWTQDKHRRVDDTPFGGGPGMLMAPQPLFDAIEAVQNLAPAAHAAPPAPVIYLCPDGEPLTNELARELSTAPRLILLSGHYEGIDQRVRDHAVTREISIGDYVLSNGTLAAAVLIDCVARQIPGVLGEENSLTADSFNNSLLAFPQYTRPAEFRGHAVPSVLFSGDHGAIARWRAEQQTEKTRARRPDLFSTHQRQHANTATTTSTTIHEPANPQFRHQVPA
ncbi:MAG: tRNA (guanosine(37)-N1)-methyltransferase TrmD [Puniceicoccales bacterium]|jgi:tRNA (guanine37-N1)-methyltransferase|nr:tRNA (guanosine(37)-N1)-methyltransferase TrmD [Puniceicoccales bacterium]